MSAPIALACARARQALQSRLDEDPREPVATEEVERHLQGCPDCRALAHELAEVQAALRGSPLLHFPDEALEQVWARTVRAPKFRVRRAAALWSGLAAAGVLAALLLTLPRGARAPHGPSQEEVLRAAADVQFVLRLTDHEIRHQGTRALSEVLNEEVAPALRRAERDGSN
jgi:predicted anti-sigma-YlaC factor YlaD